MRLDNVRSFYLLACAFAHAFETKTRDNGDTFRCLKDGAPEWMRDAIRAAHDAVDEVPSDDVYECCHSAALVLADENAPDLDEGAHEFADGEVSPYNASRVAWLAESPIDRATLCDEAREEMGSGEDGIFGLIAIGWYEWARRIFYAIAEGINEEADANPCAWVAGWNSPGCLPEMEPAGFETWEEARDFIAEELERFADSESEQEDGRPIADEEAARRIAEWLNESAGEDEDVSQNVAGLVYWIARGEVPA